MDFKIESRSPKTCKFFEAIMPSMIEQLGLTNSRKDVLIKIEKCETLGMTVAVDILGAYVIVIKPASIRSMGLTLAHEMIHVQQMARGILKTVKGINYWRGRKYSKKTKYLDMPWEIGAFSRQEIIFRRSIE
jgi:hypothetical protein